MNVLIIEDEKPAARRLYRMLEKQGVKVATMLHSVAESKDWFMENNQPDLVFLDIQLSDGLSFEIFENLDLKSAVIFTTAYDEYALEAFKLNSIDYLLKPIDEEDLHIALNKYKTFFSDSEEVNQSIIDIKRILLGEQKKIYKTRFTIKVGQHLKIIETKDIECFYSQNKGTYAYTKSGRSYLLDMTLEQLELEVDLGSFFRINRTFIVNISKITDIISYSNSRLKISLNTFNEQELIVSRDRVKDFKNWIG
ncbi:LytR/AlgR family response regulator transcription factor [Pseudofulvibacter geojedonensis]|uniref:LytR/AlgR family response regulator transcription factor n=1 Tax=Pseudofulvibacter geojedonensis TaxID=1123758 RepID=A0ABW3HZ92_9FLAO